MRVDESNIGIWLWVVLLVEINATWIAMDLWLKAHGHEYLTTEVREGLAHGGWTGIALAAFIGMMLGVMYYHFMWQRQ